MQLSQQSKLSKAEYALLEAYAFYQCCESLRELCVQHYKKYFKLLKSNNWEEDVVDAQIIRFLIQDILQTNEYTLEGIANYIRMPFDVVCDMAAGLNTNPSFIIVSKIIKLHATLRPNVYGNLINKLITKNNDSSYGLYQQ